MTTSPVLEQLAQQGRAAVKSLPGLMHSALELAREMPDHPWAMAALIALASATVTLITARRWPRAVAPPRTSLDVPGVRRLARRGMGAPAIARYTRLSHDAVATILRASTLARGERSTPMRKTRPSAA